jgi:biopolymer transport protein ExbB
MRMNFCADAARIGRCLLLVLAVGGATADVPSAFAQEDAAEQQVLDVPAEAPSVSMLTWVWNSLGLGYSAIFLSLSLALMAVVIINLIKTRRKRVLPTELIDEFEADLREKNYQQAYKAAQESETMLGAMLAAGLEALSYGHAKSMEAVEDACEEETMKLQHRAGYAALIGATSPMIGLFGTVHGMIGSFEKIAIANTTPSAQVLAEGISTALFTTLIGLALAIPAMAVYHFIRNRVEKLTLESHLICEALMRPFVGVGAKGPGASRSVPDAG